MNKTFNKRDRRKAAVDVKHHVYCCRPRGSRTMSTRGQPPLLHYRLVDTRRVPGLPLVISFYWFSPPVVEWPPFLDKACLEGYITFKTTLAYS